MQKLPRIMEEKSLEDKFKILYDWCFHLSQELSGREQESQAEGNNQNES